MGSRKVTQTPPRSTGIWVMRGGSTLTQGCRESGSDSWLEPQWGSHWQRPPNLAFSAAAGPLADPMLLSQPLPPGLAPLGPRLMHFFPPPMIRSGEPFEALFAKALASEDPTHGKREKRASRVDKASALDKRADGIMIEMRKQDQWDPFLDPLS
ncbi:hypothetical protein MG293_016027 [Ovis ammon polii]|uniref:Uncharacterized protein n=1 Tax=Ovis ammon polii TaxID=230172 RepID=A0AAD4Y399_OVIAM|nr:hypothetical protein MG293_016027 [Ovis ammon polii]